MVDLRISRKEIYLSTLYKTLATASAWGAAVLFLVSVYLLWKGVSGDISLWFAPVGFVASAVIRWVGFWLEGSHMEIQKIAKLRAQNDAW